MTYDYATHPVSDVHNEPTESTPLEGGLQAAVGLQSDLFKPRRLTRGNVDKGGPARRSLGEKEALPAVALAKRRACPP
jgi:hypothetical protein